MVLQLPPIIIGTKSGQSNPPRDSTAALHRIQEHSHQVRPTASQKTATHYRESKKKRPPHPSPRTHPHHLNRTDKRILQIPTSGDVFISYLLELPPLPEDDNSYILTLANIIDNAITSRKGHSAPGRRTIILYKNFLMPLGILFRLYNIILWVGRLSPIEQSEQQ